MPCYYYVFVPSHKEAPVIQLPNGLCIWACPECAGQTIGLTFPDYNRCISCGRTMREFLLGPHQRLRGFIEIHGLKFPDDLYSRGESIFEGDPSWPPRLDP